MICAAVLGYVNGSYGGYFVLLCVVMCCEGG